MRRRTFLKTFPKSKFFLIPNLVTFGTYCKISTQLKSNEACSREYIQVKIYDSIASNLYKQERLKIV